MATESVATLHLESPKPIGTEADLFLIDDGVLSVYISQYSTASPPDADSIEKLHRMVKGLAWASIAVGNEMIRDKKQRELWNESAECIAFATMVLTELADGAVAELGNAAGMERAA